MDLQGKKLAAAQDALKTLESVLKEPVSTIVQDATIQRFEYTLDQIWKVLQYILEEQEGLRVPSPKAAFRAWGTTHHLPAPMIEELLRMVDDRNRTTHLYNEETAHEIYLRIRRYTVLLRDLIDGID